MVDPLGLDIRCCGEETFDGLESPLGRFAILGVFAD
jgi:hypothetical protein